jgi:hypothetical protein
VSVGSGVIREREGGGGVDSEKQGIREHYIKKSFLYCTPYQVLFVLLFFYPAFTTLYEF